jgi:hypothetical protein
MYRAHVVAAVIALTTVSGLACGESKDAADPAATLQQQVEQMKTQSRALERRVEADRRRLLEARRERIQARRHRIQARREALLRAKRRAARRAAREAAAQAQAQASCDPNYTGACLDPNASDYDCAGGSGDGPEYTGPVQVVGSDPYGLDSDGDGYACE